MHTENQSVEAWETNQLVFDDLLHHLRAGESVFISPKKTSRKESPVSLEKKSKKPLFYADKSLYLNRL
ncbi:MAG: hypothetical protein ACXACB_00030 [Promethearchaeota archaeon]